MQYIRFMGSEELLAFLWGETLENCSDWKTKRFISDSIGFCFFPYGEKYDSAEEILRYLAGIVDVSCVAIFEPIGPIQMHKGIGKYRDPDAPMPKNFQEMMSKGFKTIKKEEYSVTRYSNKTFRLIHHGTPYFDGKQWKIEWMK